MSISWNPLNAQVSGYQLQYAKDKQFKINKKTITISDEKSSSKKITNLSNKEGYFFRMRSYKVVDKKKVYSDWMEFPEYITLPSKAYGQAKKEYLKNPTFSQGYIYLENIGISIPLLDRYNDEWIKCHDNGNWFGESNTITMQELFDSLNRIMHATGYGVEGSGANGFSAWDFKTEWNYTGYNYIINTFCLERWQQENYYTLDINTHLDKYESVVSAYKDIAPISRDLTLFLISAFSSKPDEVFDYIYDALYYGRVTYSYDKYVKVADCKIKLDDKLFDENNGYWIRFYIKKK